MSEHNSADEMEGKGLSEQLCKDPQWIHQEVRTNRDDALVAVREARRDTLRFLLFSNSGGLLIVFTLAGALVQSTPFGVPANILQLIWPATFFAIGLTVAGYAVLVRRQTLWKLYLNHADFYGSIIYDRLRSPKQGEKMKTRLPGWIKAIRRSTYWRYLAFGFFSEALA
jgi:hypothetical protein